MKSIFLTVISLMLTIGVFAQAPAPREREQKVDEEVEEQPKSRPEASPEYTPPPKTYTPSYSYTKTKKKRKPSSSVEFGFDIGRYTVGNGDYSYNGSAVDNFVGLKYGGYFGIGSDNLVWKFGARYGRPSAVTQEGTQVRDLEYSNWDIDLLSYTVYTGRKARTGFNFSILMKLLVSNIKSETIIDWGDFDPNAVSLYYYAGIGYRFAFSPTVHMSLQGQLGFNMSEISSDDEKAQTGYLGGLSASLIYRI